MNKEIPPRTPEVCYEHKSNPIDAYIRGKSAEEVDAYLKGLSTEEIDAWLCSELEENANPVSSSPVTPQTPPFSRQLVAEDSSQAPDTDCETTKADQDPPIENAAAQKDESRQGQKKKAHPSYVVQDQSQSNESDDQKGKNHRIKEVPARTKRLKQVPEQEGESESACLTDSEEQLDPAIYNSIIRKFGPPFFDDRHGYRLNQPFFARLWGVKRLAFYDRASEDYYSYNEENGCFERLRVEKVCGMIRDDIIAEALRRDHGDIAAKLNVGLQRSIADLVKTDNAVCKEDFFALDASSDPVIHVGNGMVCLTDSGICLHPFDPKYKSRNQIPISYNPQARCERFLKELLQPMMSSEDSDLLQRYAGLILIKGNRAQKILLLIGKGGAGKGTLLGVFLRVIGRKNAVQLRVSKLNERFEQARVIGKLLVHVAEATEDFLNQDGAEVVKSLCGHDSLDAERKHVHEPMAFEGRYPIIIISNEQLRVRLAGDEEAWDRRLEIILCPNARPAGAPIVDNFDQLLVREEGEGILAWMIEGARKHWEELRDHRGFSSTAVQRGRVKELLARSKAIETFVQTQIQKDSKSNVTVGELYEAYAHYCISKDWTPTTERKFEDASQHLILRHWGTPKSHSLERDNKNKRGYRGIALAASDSKAPDYEWD
jgi:P4 family phage/plasmid primase-like protien